MSSSTDHASLEKAREFAAECSHALGGELHAVLVDRAASVAAGSCVTVLVVTAITPRMLREVSTLAQRWKRKKFATPILLSQEDLATSCDVFPLEILMLMTSCEMIQGESNPLAALVIDNEHLRLEVEQQLKGKVLHLRQAFLETGADGRSLRTLMLDSSAGFEATMRGLLTLAGKDCGEGHEIPAEVENALGISLETFRRIQAARLAGKELALGEVDELYRRYLEELTVLARTADRITRA